MWSNNHPITACHWSKRAADLLIAIPLFVCLLPVYIFLALLVRTFVGSPVLYRQARPGLHSHSFIIYKFRSMSDAKDEQGRALPDKDRLTRLGRLLRSSSLDELPELFNVIKGDMSLVGPRPLLMEYLPCYTEREKLRHEVRPGITGWAQIHGRNLLQWNDRLAMDVWYVENWSLLLDFHILCRTVTQVIKRDGVAVDTAAIESNLRRERGQQNISQWTA